jgi:DNA polymerase (family 10)
MTRQLNNNEIADALNKMADVRQLEGANKFQILAYKKAANAIAGHTEQVSSFSKQKLLTLKGVGPAIADKVVELCSNGAIASLEEAKSTFNLGAMEQLTAIPGVGPKKAQAIIAQGIMTRAELVSALKSGTFKTTDVPKLLSAIEFADLEQQRFPLFQVLRVVQHVFETVKRFSDKAEYAGSVRRFKETVKDVDIVAQTKHVDELLKAFCSCGDVIMSGSSKASIFVSGMNMKVRVDLLIVDASCWGSALNHFTGSKEHNVALRTLAKSRGLTVSEFGVYDGTKMIGGANEQDLYNILGLDYHPPELREGDPKKIPSDIISCIPFDVHIHTTYSDGLNSVIDMAIEAKRIGMSMIGISDHIAKSMIGHALYSQPGALNERFLEIKQAETQTGLKILAGAEVDISSDGTLEMPDSSEIEKLDYIMASIHMSPGKDVQRRLLSAIESGKVNIIGHCTGRSFGKRPSANINWSDIFIAARKHNVSFEINGQDDRLDPPADIIAQGLSLGVKFLPCSDAHSIEQLDRCHKQAIMMGRKALMCNKDIANISHESK